MPETDFSAVQSAESMWPGLKGMKTVSSKVEVEHQIQSPRDPTGSNGFYLTDIRSRKIQAVNPQSGPLNPGTLMMPELSS